MSSEQEIQVEIEKQRQIAQKHLADPRVQNEPVIREAWQEMLDAVNKAEKQLKEASKIGYVACQKIWGAAQEQLYGK